MGDIESDYTDYENAKDAEGGLHPGCSNPARGLVVTVAVVVGLLVVGAIVLALIPR
ncbi:MAG TPA: hypothetical protein VH643_04810 [Gemmataceae bacterium]|jgi:hypothetical protein